MRESDGRIVPKPAEDQSAGEKPGNAGVGKVSMVSRCEARARPVLRDGLGVLTRPLGGFTFATGIPVMRVRTASSTLHCQGWPRTDKIVLWRFEVR